MDTPDPRFSMPNSTPAGGPRPNAHRLCVAPMLDWTDRHLRHLLRLITRHTRLYTEMVTTAALLHGPRARLLAHDPCERPLALQLGGSEPPALAECARLAEQAGYDEVNLNVGCPSPRVQSGAFGACLMAEPRTLAECVGALREAVALPVTVKTRIGVDDRDSYPELLDLAGTLAEAGCQTLILHARKAWLHGLSPKQNRTVPPLRPDWVYRIRRDLPGLPVVLNGGVQDLARAEAHLRHVDGVMIGRAAYHDPYLLAEADRRIFGRDSRPPTREAVLEAYLPYVARQLARDVPLARITRHMLGLFQGVPGARAWRRHLSERAHRSGAGVEVIRAAAHAVAAARERRGDTAGTT